MANYFADRVRKGRQRRRYGGSSTGTFQSAKPIIYWDSGRNKYVVASKYDPTKTPPYVADLKVLLNTATYNGNQEKSWSVSEIELDTLKKIVAAHFGDYDFTPKPDANFSTSAQVTSAAEAALAIFTHAGKDASNKAYRALSLEYHPDRNKSPNATETMANINAAYDRLKRELGW